MSFRVAVAEDERFVRGWGAVERGNGFDYRWLEGEHALLAVDSAAPWHELEIAGSFALAVRHGIGLEILGDDHQVVAGGLLAWTGRGFQRHTIGLDAHVPAGRATIRWTPIQSWLEPNGQRRLSINVVSIAGCAGRSETRPLGRRLLNRRRVT